MLTRGSGSDTNTHVELLVASNTDLTVLGRTCPSPPPRHIFVLQVVGILSSFVTTRGRADKTFSGETGDYNCPCSPAMFGWWTLGSRSHWTWDVRAGACYKSGQLSIS